MVTILGRKLRRDVRRQPGQFFAVALALALGVAAFVGAYDAYLNLRDSFDNVYDRVWLADATVTATDTDAVADRARALLGRPVVEARRQAEAPVSVHGHKLLGRLVGMPTARQPDLNRLIVIEGGLPAGPDQVVAEQHLASHFDLHPGAHVDVWAAGTWRSVTVAGVAVSGEYLWPARTSQEILTSPEHFGVLFAPDALVVAADPAASRQVVVRFGERNAVAEGVARLTAETAAHGDGVVVAREQQPSVKALDDDVKAFGSFAVLFPLLFLAGGALGGYIVLARLIRAQRAIVGTLLANGVPRRRVLRHYVGFGVAAGLAGSVTGAVGGVFLAGWVAGLYADAIGLPFSVARFHPLTPLIGVAAGLVAAVVAAATPARAAARLNPAEAMSPSPGTGRGGRSLAERLVPPLRRLPARWLMVLRGVGRNRRRTLLTAAGVVTALCLILTAAGLRDTVNAVLDTQFSTVQREDAQIMLASPSADTLARLERVPGVAATERFTRLDASVTTERGARYDTLLFALEPDTAMHEFRPAGGEADPQRGFVVGDGMRRTLGLRVGDRLTVTAVGLGGADVTVTDRVAGFVDEPMSPVVYLSTGRLARATGTDAVNGALIRLATGADRAAVAEAVTALPSVTAYLDTRSLEIEMREAFSLYNTIVGLMLLFGAVLAGALLFNAMTANAAERTAELGALQAAGMGRRTIGRLVGAENLLLAAAGILPGLLAGHQLARAFMSTYETEGYSWPLQMRGSTLVAAAAVVLLTAVVAQWPALRGLRRLDLARVVRERAL